MWLVFCYVKRSVNHTVSGNLRRTINWLNKNTKYLRTNHSFVQRIVFGWDCRKLTRCAVEVDKARTEGWQKSFRITARKTKLNGTVIFTQDTVDTDRQNSGRPITNGINTAASGTLTISNTSTWKVAEQESLSKQREIFCDPLCMCGPEHKSERHFVKLTFSGHLIASRILKKEKESMFFDCGRFPMKKVLMITCLLQRRCPVEEKCPQQRISPVYIVHFVYSYVFHWQLFILMITFLGKSSNVKHFNICFSGIIRNYKLT
jgi:hypothetical protein